MADEKPISAKDISPLIEKAVDDLLHQQGIYKIGHYGWSNENDPDPKFLGHAMWQTESLSMKYTSPATISSVMKLEASQKFLMIAGSDFDGLMEAARLSIGLALFHHETVREWPFMGSSVDSFFQLHLIGAMMILGSASDRIRDVFVAAVFRTDTKTYQARKCSGKKRAWYVTPFSEAAEVLSAPPVCPLADEFVASAAKLPLLAQKVHTFREQRNEIVHVVATELGRQEKKVINEPPGDFADWNSEMEKSLREAGDIARAKFHESVTKDLSMLSEWYRLLVEVSNHIFIIENLIRTNS